MTHPRDHLGAIAGGTMRVMQEVDNAHQPTGAYGFWFLCPGCNDVHVIHVFHGEGAVGEPPKRPFWNWDGNLDAPTFSPSLLVKGAKVCHSFVKGGQIQFLGDCQHPLAGQTAAIPPLPDWLRP